MNRRSTKRASPSKIETTKKSKQLKLSDSDGDSSDSSVGNYLKSADQIDLDSSFFKLERSTDSFDNIEKEIFSGVQRLSGSEDSDDGNDGETVAETHKINFQRLHDYNKKMEEAKTCVQKYTTKIENSDESKLDILQLLSLGETKVANKVVYAETESDAESANEWEEVEEGEVEVKVEPTPIPKHDVQITLQLPNKVRQKKQIDLMACIKRRINKVKKENQIFIHKVHLLCWIAHGNYVNSVLNNEDLLGIALSLLPSENCYPPKQADLKYMEMITKWFGRTIKIEEPPGYDDTIKLTPLPKTLQRQIQKKLATSKRDFVLIFIAILRSLGLQCRLVLSLQCLPLKPPASELCSLTTKEKQAPKEVDDKSSISKPSTSKITEDIKSEAEPKTKHIKSEAKPKSKEIKSEAKPKTNEIKSGAKPKIEQIKSGAKPKTKDTKSVAKPKTEQTKSRAKPKTEEIKSETKPKNKDTKSGAKPKTLEIKSGTKPKNKEIKSDTQPKTKRESSSDTTKPNLRKLSADKSKEPSRTSRSRTAKTKSEPIKISQVDGADDSPSTSKPKPSKIRLSKLKKHPEKSPECISRHHLRAAKSTPDKPYDSDDDFSPKRPLNKSPIKQTDIRNDIIGIMKGRMMEEKYKSPLKTFKKEESDDSDYAPEPIRKKQRSRPSEEDFDLKANVKVKQRVKPRKELDNRVLSTDSEEERERRKKIGVDVWVEVFLEAEEKWISVDVIKEQIHCVTEIFSRASHPVSYILAWNNNFSIKDVTARYCPNWNTVTRKLRVDPQWWSETLKPYEGRKSPRDREEDEDLARQQLDKPLPTTIGEYKNHPLYALKRHLLKFEAIYPPNAMTLGFVRKEAVYARECVHTLHSREIWVKHAKVVKAGEKPYKIVKARPKYDKLSGTVTTDIPLEIFGKWQVQEYEPPTAENGIVPRNAFGNVELFKACMLPKKTVHLQLPGLNKVARKLQIDCAPAVVGFEFHAGGSHPTFDGYVVCEEFKDTLIAAWEQEQAEAAIREHDKYEKRVYGNWRKLIKAVLIRERLKARYDFGQPDVLAAKKKKSKGPRFVAKRRRVCSGSESD